jgi:hypothetical protein
MPQLYKIVCARARKQLSIIVKGDNNNITRMSFLNGDFNLLTRGNPDSMQE